MAGGWREEMRRKEIGGCGRASESISRRSWTKVRRMAMFTSTARGECSTLESMATPCPVMAEGRERRPPREFALPDWHGLDEWGRRGIFAEHGLGGKVGGVQDDRFQSRAAGAFNCLGGGTLQGCFSSDEIRIGRSPGRNAGRASGRVCCWMFHRDFRLSPDSNKIGGTRELS